MELLFFLDIWTCGWSEEVKEQTSKFCLNKFNFKQLLCWAGRQDDVSHFRFGGMLLLAADLIVPNYTIISPQLNVHFLESSGVFNKVLTFLPQKEKRKEKVVYLIIQIYNLKTNDKT